MNKKLGKVAAIALSAAMITSAFAMSTSASFAAVSKPTAKATLGYDTYYLAKGESTAAQMDVSKIAQTVLAAKGTKFVKDSDGAAITPNATATTAYTDGTVKIDNTTSGGNVTVTFDGSNNLVFTPTNDGKTTGDTKVTISGLKLTDNAASNGVTYDVDPVTIDIKTVDTATYAAPIWTAAAQTAGTSLTTLDPTSDIVSSVNVGETAYLTDVYVDKSKQTGGAFAQADVAPVTVAGTPVNGTDTLKLYAPTSTSIVKSSNTDGLMGVSAGTQAVSYLDHFGATKSTSLTVAGAYNKVTAVGEKDATTDLYPVTYAGGTAKLTAAQLASATLNVDAANTTPDANKLDLSNVGTKIGTIKADAALTIKGGTVGTVSSTSDVTLEAGTANDADHTPVASSADTITADGTVTVGAIGDTANVTVGTVTAGGAVTVTSGSTAQTALGNTKINSIKADNVTVSNKKSVIGAIAPKTTAGTVTVDTVNDFDGVSLPALDGYALTVNGDATVASVAKAGASTVATGKTLTVSGKAAFTGAVTGSGTIKIAPASLTIPASGNTFTLNLTSVKAGATAFTTTTPTTGTTSNPSDSDDSKASTFDTIVTPGYYAVANNSTTAVIDSNLSSATIKDATTGTTADPDAGVPTTGTPAGTKLLEVTDGSLTTLAVQPFPATALDTGNKIKWTATTDLTGGTTVKSDTFTLGADDTTGLTNTISATYSAYKPTANDVLVKAQMVKDDADSTSVGTPVYYHVRVVAKKTATTSDFSVAAAQPFVKVGKTDTVTVTPNGTTALGGTVDVKSSDNSVAVASATSTLTNNNVQFDITGVKAGNATFTVTWTKADGTKVSHDVSVYVSDSPVVAYVNGKVANPTDTLSFTQSTTVPITFVSADGTKLDTFNYNAGNGKIMSTRAYADSKWNGVSGEYGMYMNGPVGSATGVYVNGQKICNVKVADRPFTCDTTCNFDLKAGKTYEFKLTPAAGTTFDNFTFNTAKDAALSTNGYKKNADGTINAFVKAVQKGTYGVYVTINGVQYKVFAVTVD